MTHDGMVFCDRWGKASCPRENDKIDHRHGIYVFLLAKGRVLLSWQRYAPDLAELPGGKIDDGETPEQALRREMLEESGLVLPSGPPIREYQHEKGFFHRQGNPPCFSVHHQIYWVMEYGESEPVTSWDEPFSGPEGNRLQWVPLANLGTVRLTWLHDDTIQRIARELG